MISMPPLMLFMSSTTRMRLFTVTCCLSRFPVARFLLLIPVSCPPKEKAAFSFRKTPPGCREGKGEVA